MNRNFIDSMPSKQEAELNAAVGQFAASTSNPRFLMCVSKHLVLNIILIGYKIIDVNL